MKRIFCCSILLLTFFSIQAGRSLAQHVGVKVSVTPRQFVGFGQVQITKYVEKNVIIKNDTSSPQAAVVQISAPTGSQYVLIGGARTVSIAPGQRDTLVVRYTPTTVGQNFDSLVMLHDGDTTYLKDPVKEYLFGTGLVAPDTFPRPSVSTSSINFRNVPIGTKLTRSFIVKNISDSIRHLAGTISMPSLPFAIDSGGAPFSLDSGKSQIVYVSFTPTVVGTFTDSIIVNSNGDSTYRRLRVLVTGVGYILDTNHVTLKLLSRRLDFGTIDTGKFATVNFTLANVSDSNVKLATRIAAPRSPFILQGVSFAVRDTIAQNDSIVFTAAFSPTAAGNFSDSIVISTNAYDTASQRVVIHLVGIAKVVVTGAVATPLIDENAIRVFPNPTLGLSRVDLRGVSEAARELVIVDAKGAVVYSRTLNAVDRASGLLDIDLRGQTAGAYFIELRGQSTIEAVKINLVK